VKVTATILTAALFAGAAAPNVSAVGDPSAECRYKGNGGWSHRDIIREIHCAEDRWAVPGGSHKAVSVAKCESGLNPRAYYAGHGGLYQHVIRYWPSRFRAHRVRGWHMHPGVYNARSAVVVTMRMVHSGGWQPWSCA
jgi:hypothetical protein